MAKKEAPSGAMGEWSGGWTATRAKRRTRDWSAGWDRGAKCPPDPLQAASGGRRATTAPEGGYHAGERWQRLHQDRVRLVRVLRRAGYVSRHRWPREEGERLTRRHAWRYLASTRDGLASPVAGEPGADPWELAGQLLRCAAAWHHQLRRPADGGLRIMDAPYRCNKMHACPVCAATHSSKLASAMRQVVAAEADGGGDLALVTLTQRDSAGEPLAAAMARWRRAWYLLRGTGRAAVAWRGRVAGTYMGYEVTRGQEGRGGAMGLWWHVHAHVLVALQPGQDVAAVRAWVAAGWEAATRTAAEEAGLPGYGWDPASGVQRNGETLAAARRRVEAGDLDGPWWVPVDRTEPRQVYQAAKYPTPAVTLHPVALAEWVAVASGRRWHEGTGTLRGVLRLAEELDVDLDLAEELVAMDDEEAALPRPPDLGALVSMAGPGDCPTRRRDPDAHLTMATWRTTWGEWRDVPVDVLRLVQALDGYWYQSTRGRYVVVEDGVEVVKAEGVTRWCVQLPTEWMLDQSRRTEEELAAWREAVKAAREASEDV